MEVFNAAFPVYIHHEGLQLPSEGTYFVVAGNGLWLHKDTGLVRGFVPVKNISVLEDLKADEYVQCRLPKIPAQHVWRIKKFFRDVVAEYHAEANTILFFNKETGEYKIHIPQQRVSAGGVHYKREALTHLPEMQGFLQVGTIHSHCDFGAFHSGTDVGDEEHFDGLHCTFGHNDRDDFTISASIVVNGRRLKVDPLTVLEGIEHIQGEHYCLTSVPEETVAEWSQGLDQWMTKVEGHKRGASIFAMAGDGRWNWWNKVPETDEPRSDDGTIKTGDTVLWTDNSGSLPLKDVCGDGPFRVLNRTPNELTLVTKLGVARFDAKLFKKAGQ